MPDAPSVTMGTGSSANVRATGMGKRDDNEADKPRLKAAEAQAELEKRRKHHQSKNALGMSFLPLLRLWCSLMLMLVVVVVAFLMFVVVITSLVVPSRVGRDRVMSFCLFTRGRRDAMSRSGVGLLS